MEGAWADVLAARARETNEIFKLRAVLAWERARPGATRVGRVRIARAVRDRSRPPFEGERSKLGGRIRFGTRAGEGSRVTPY